MLNKMQSKVQKTNDKANDVSSRVIFNEYHHLLTITLFYPRFDKFYKILSVLLIVIIYAVLISHIYFFIITSWLSADDFMLMTQSFNYTVLTIFFLALQMITAIFKTDIKCIHEIIGNNENIYEDDSDEKIKIIKSNYLNFKRKVKLLIPLINISCGVFVLLIGPILNRLSGESENKIYNEYGVNFLLPVNIWYPFEAHEGINFIIGCLSETFLVTILLLFLHSVGSLYVCSTINAALHLELLKYSIKTLEIRSLKLFNKFHNKGDHKLQPNHLYNNEDFINCVDYCLKINIKHHYDILRLTKHINRWATYPLPMTVGMSALMVALSAFLATSGKGNLGGVISSLLMCAGQVFYIFCICYFGQSITDMNRKVNFAVFYIPCYKYPKKLNKSIKIIQLFTCKDLTINGIFNFTANVETFGTVLNTAYSYMSLLLAWNT